MDSDAFREQYYSTKEAEYKVTGKIQYDDLPKLAKMMVDYSRVEYDPEIHSPTMDKDMTPHWLNDEQQDHKFVHIYDLDGKITRDFILCRSLGSILDLLPNTKEDMIRCEAIEAELFFLMNRMTWMINKVCYDPEREVSFDENYAKNRFSRRMRVNLPKLNLLLSHGKPTCDQVTDAISTCNLITDTTSNCDLITKTTSNLITGSVPTYADFLAYACLHDLKEFVPQCFAGINNKHMTLFFRHMEGLTQLKKWFENQGKEGEYIRPPRPSITTRIGYFA